MQQADTYYEVKRISIAGNKDIPVHHWYPNDPSKAIVVVFHGMAEHGLRYAELAGKLVEEGFEVFVPDQEAHGLAVSSLDELGIASDNWFDQQVENMHAFINLVKNGDKKVFLFGHSMGSFLAQRFVQLHGRSIEGLILSATNGKKDPLLGMGILIALLQMKLRKPTHRSRLIHNMSFIKFNKQFAPNRTKSDWLSRDENEVDKYIADPLCGFVCNASFFHSSFSGIKKMLDENEIEKIPKDLPVYCFAGSLDPVGDSGKGFNELVRKWRQKGINVQSKLYEGGRHEMLHETNKAEVMQDIIQWLNKQMV